MRGRTFATLYTIVRLCLLLSLTIWPFIAGALNAISRHTLNGDPRRDGCTSRCPGVRLALWLGGGITVMSGLAAQRRMSLLGRRRRRRGCRSVIDVGRRTVAVDLARAGRCRRVASTARSRHDRTLHRPRRRRGRRQEHAGRAAGRDDCAPTRPVGRPDARAGRHAGRVSSCGRSCCTAATVDPEDELGWILEDRRIHVDEADPAEPRRTAWSSCATASRRRRSRTRASRAGMGVEYVERRCARRQREARARRRDRARPPRRRRRGAGSRRSRDRFEREGADFHAAVRRRTASSRPIAGWVIVDASGHADAVADRVWAVVEPHL